MKNYILLMRPKHYVKNFLIFFPIVFSGELLSFEYFQLTLIGFLNFSLIASAVYIFNDINDIEKDKLHPTKKNRPLASGKVSKQAAIFLFLFLIFLSILISVLLLKQNIFASLCLYLYLFINILYSLGFKNIPILDIIILSFGFLLRVFYGGVIINVPVSNWLYLTVMSTSFYLSLGKRRNELINLTNNNTRIVLKKYNKEFLDKFMYVCLCMSIIFYSLWATDISAINYSKYLIYTIPIIISIFMKYSLNIEFQKDGDPIEVVYNDKILVGMIVFYALLIFSLIYLL